MKNSQSHHEYYVEYRYLLGMMEPAELEAVQTSLLESDEAVDRVREAENELFDAYARGDLPEEFVEAFQERFANDPGNRAKFGFSRGMARRGRTFASWRWFAVAAALVAAVGTSVWVGRRVATPMPRPAGVAQATITATIVLPGGTTRGSAGIPSFRLPGDVTRVEIEVPEPEPRRGKYDVELRTARGESRWKASGIASPAAGERLVVRVPGPALAAGSYEMVVSGGGSPMAYHYFRIE